MSVFKRAILYLTRKKMRSILLFLLLFFMGLFMLTGLSIRSSADQAAEEMRKSISSGLEIKMAAVPGEEIYAISYNEDGELVRTLKHPLITESVAEKLSLLPGVSGYYSEMGAEMLYTGLDVVPGSFTEELKMLEESGEPADSEQIASSSAWSKANDFHIVQGSEYYPYFRNGAFELIAGRHLHIDDTRKILISEELAARNGLKISILNSSFPHGLLSPIFSPIQFLRHLSFYIGDSASIILSMEEMYLRKKKTGLWAVSPYL